MKDQLICQSCAMPLAPETYGTHADGSPNHEYCIYCYKDGKFTADVTMDGMIEHNLEYLDMFNKDSGKQYTRDEAREEMRKFFPQLKRWKK